MLLDSLLNQLMLEVEVEQITRQQYERGIKRFGLFLHRRPAVADLTYENVNQFLAWFKQQYKSSNTTIKNNRIALCRLWNYAAELKLCDAYNPKRIRKVKTEPQIVQAWSVGEVRQLLAAAQTLAGYLRTGVPAALFMQAWIRVGFETALRPSDLRLITWAQVSLENGTILLCQHKTGNSHAARISSESKVLLEQLKTYETEKVFQLGKTGVYRWTHLLYEAAGAQFGFQREKRQGIGTLRKTHATEVYCAHGLAAAAESLGHVGGTRTVAKHYIDHRVLGQGQLPSLDSHANQ